MIPVPQLKDQPEGFENCDPSAALHASEEERQEREHLVKVQEFLADRNKKSIEEAKTKPPPQTVQDYHEVFGRWPAGWPPWDDASKCHRKIHLEKRRK